VDEATWLSCTDPTPMLSFLRASGKASERRCLLWACACVRRAWALLTDERSRRAVEVAEEHADGPVGVKELRAAVRAADKAVHRARRAEREARAAIGAAGVARRYADRTAKKARPSRARQAQERAEQAARWAAERAELLAAQAAAGRRTQEAARAAVLCVRAAEYGRLGAPGTQISLEQAIEAAAFAADDTDFPCCVLRDIFAPFRPLPALDPAWLDWGGGTVRHLAEAIYEQRRFEDTPVLADALEEAGCTDSEILGHLRSPGPHARGCRVVDLLLGKE
jgi:hypothetical protein